MNAFGSCKSERKWWLSLHTSKENGGWDGLQMMIKQSTGNKGRWLRWWKKQMRRWWCLRGRKGINQDWELWAALWGGITEEYEETNLLEKIDEFQAAEAVYRPNSRRSWSRPKEATARNNIKKQTDLRTKPWSKTRRIFFEDWLSNCQLQQSQFAADGWWIPGRNPVDSNITSGTIRFSQLILPRWMQMVILLILGGLTCKWIMAGLSFKLEIKDLAILNQGKCEWFHQTNTLRVTTCRNTNC